MAGLDPAIHGLRRDEEGVDASRGFSETAGGSGNCVPARARIKSGHDDSGESSARPGRVVTAGIAEIGFVAKEGRTRLSHLYQTDPLRVLFPDAPPGELPVAVLVTTSGGLVGGDRLRVAVDMGPDTAAHVTAQSAEKIYRSNGPDTALDIALTVGAGARLEYLPPETILFDAARLRRRAVVELAADATLLAGEILVFGRIASGERMASGLVHDGWELRREGRLIWSDSFHLADDSLGSLLSKAADPSCLDGATACATLLLASSDAAKFLGVARNSIAASPVRGGATMVSGVLVARLLGGDAQALRGAYVRLAGQLRQAQAGLPAVLPGLWHV
jgi:urease accessory protein